MAGLAEASPVVQRLRSLQDLADSAAARPIQRVVTKSTAPWGASKGKWVSDKLPGRHFDTKAEGEAAEQQAQAEQDAANEAAWANAVKQNAFILRNDTGRLTAHYNDGWGAAYGITSHAELIDYVYGYNEDDGELGEHSLALGTFKNEQMPQREPCDIVYNVLDPVTISAGGWTEQVPVREIFHCGPESYRF